MLTKLDSNQHLFVNNSGRLQLLFRFNRFNPVRLRKFLKNCEKAKVYNAVLVIDTGVEPATFTLE